MDDSRDRDNEKRKEIIEAMVASKKLNPRLMMGPPEPQPSVWQNIWDDLTKDPNRNGIKTRQQITRG